MPQDSPTPESISGETTLDERAALRAYLQRAEVRLSTMHRIAGVFLNGAGILFLLPVFLKDVVLQIFSILVPEVFSGHTEYIPHIFMLAGILALPMWAFYLLIEDIVKFYFTAYHAGIKEEFFHPRFILSGIAFSDDESDRINQEIVNLEHSKDMRKFIVPENIVDREYYKKVYKETDGQIVPASRKNILSQIKDVTKHGDMELFYTAFGLTGFVDRTLTGEAAKMEMSLVRHALNLRHLVLRYAKALLMFVFTTFLLLIFNQIINIINNPATFNNSVVAMQVLSLSFAIWAVLTPAVVTQPMRWISEAAEKRLYTIHDSRLKFFEQVVIIISVAIFGLGMFYTNAFNLSLPKNIWGVTSTLASIALFLYWNLKTISENFSTKNNKENRSEKPNNSEIPKEEEVKMPVNEKNPIFISYSHKDSHWFEKIKQPLEILEKQKGIQVWHDKRIKSGSKWKEEITSALHSAKVAVLLVTNDFLSSDFIQSNELPHILKTANKQGLTILWIAVKPSLYGETEISDFQAANDPNKPLNSLSEYECDDEIIKICKKIQEAAK